jgi:hypothetical protein
VFGESRNSGSCRETAVESRGSYAGNHPFSRGQAGARVYHTHLAFLSQTICANQRPSLLVTPRYDESFARFAESPPRSRGLVRFSATGPCKQKKRCWRQAHTFL